MSPDLSPSSLLGLLARHRTVSITALIIAIAIPYVRHDYTTYLSYGPGGLPYNVTGWLTSTVFLRALAQEAFSTAVYDDPTLPFAQAPGYLPSGFPPRRAGTRPKIGPHPVPQRQIEQLPDEGVRMALIQRFEALAKRAQEKGVVEVRQSVHERQHQGIFVADGKARHAVAEETRGEISHVHAGLDGSVHVVMSPQDCKTVIEAGWGQRHGLDGAKSLKRIMGFSLPVNYMLIYAPRTEAEVDVVLRCVEAGVRFMTGYRGTLD
ncbi:hypothetical protein K432DRAFT_386638 [Lepidopterella palustris CBS 459.81]|uniref:Luciferase domain-containing protein n=1 Tax=Lepidopterella palustris CBS 459.81 TaxID=1314670 RepID=A0A8E2DZY0_9PEZI|nr:hypothetical protein K432DRAFT_386638 [Lepidopterella palustris CBS 459.81]